MNGQLRQGIISTAVGSLVATTVLHVIGVLDGILGWSVKVGVQVWGVLTDSVEVPLWFVMLVGVALAIVAIGRLRSAPEVDPAVEGEELKAAVELDELEEDVLLLLGRADGEQLTINRMHQSLDTTRLRIEAALEQLYKKRLVSHRSGYLSRGARFGLTSTGRDFLIDRGVV